MEIWLLFEDQSSSIYAKVTQIGLMLLIVFSTILILVQSMGNCQYVLGHAAAGTPYAQLTPCVNLTSPTLTQIGCTRKPPHRRTAAPPRRACAGPRRAAPSPRLAASPRLTSPRLAAR